MTVRREIKAKMPSISRRTVLTGGVATLMAASSLPSLPVRAQIRPHVFKVGAAEVTVFSDGDLILPVSFVLPATPAADVDALFSANNLSRDGLPSAVNIALVKTATDVILIDAGAGGDFMPGLGKFADAFTASGLNADSITKVIFTHGHADHLWGIIDPLDEDTRFSKAQHIMSAKELDFWIAADIEERVAEPFRRMAAGSNRRLKALQERIVKRKPGEEVAPGVMLFDSPGHTPGHVSVLIRSGTEQILIGGDVLTQCVVSFEKPDWRWGPDMDADLAIISRKKTLDMLATDRTRLLGYHMPWPGVGRVERKDGSYRYVAV
jgi:glyoxylase-like metal-dependent hydrolase (beta-lactamase superfamily II)